MLSRLNLLQHVDYEGPGMIADWTADRRVELNLFFAPDGLPDSIHQADGLIVMGGPMGVGDASQLPWLEAEIEIIRNWMESGKPVLGICLGAQLMAAACGARVYPHKEKELGWGTVVRSPEAAAHPLLAGWPDEASVFHWHGDTFDLPQGATLLGSSQACRHQGFALGTCLAFQFHLELGVDEVTRLAESDRFPKWQGPHIAEVESFPEESRKHAPLARKLLFSVLDRWSENLLSD